MENSAPKNRILRKIDQLISKSCKQESDWEAHRLLHEALIQKHYNAATVSIDYHRKRVVLEIVMDDASYDPKKINFSLSLLRTNIGFPDLEIFLRSCVDQDPASIAFYANLIKHFENQDAILIQI